MPHLFAAIAPRARKRSVFDALTAARWITDIKGALTLEVLAEYLELWEVLSNFSLQTEVDDVHVWQFLLLVSTLLNQLMKLYPLELLDLALGNRFGRAGHQASANSFYGRLLLTEFGQPIA